MSYKLWEEEAGDRLPPENEADEEYKKREELAKRERKLLYLEVKIIFLKSHQFMGHST